MDLFFNTTANAMYPTWLPFMVVVIIVWDLVWKLLALWRAARGKDKGWFICIGILNTVGILPIIYLLLTNNRSNKA